MNVYVGAVTVRRIVACCSGSRSEGLNKCQNAHVERTSARIAVITSRSVSWVGHVRYHRHLRPQPPPAWGELRECISFFYRRKFKIITPSKLAPLSPAVTALPFSYLASRVKQLPALHIHVKLITTPSIPHQSSNNYLVPIIPQPTVTYVLQN